MEYCLEFLKVDDISGKSLFKVIVGEIKNIRLDINNLRGQVNDTSAKGLFKNVKAIRFQILQIRDAFNEISEDLKTESEANCLVKCELENFEFLLYMTILYGILFDINSINKNLQSNDMHIMLL